MSTPASSAHAALTPEQQQFAQDIALVMQSAIERQHARAYDEAAALYEAILDALPTHADANYNLAVLKVETGRPADAIPHFEIALGENPHNGHYWVSYINALHHSGQTAAAWIAVELAQQRGFKGPAFDGLIAQMAMPSIVMPTAPANSGAVADIALASLANTAETADAASGAPAKPAGARRAPRSRMQQHAAVYNKGKYAEASSIAARLAADYPDDGTCWSALTASLHREGRFAEMIEPAQRAIGLLPAGDAVLVRILLADTLRVMGRHAEAERQCREVLELSPDNYEGTRILGLVLFDQRRAVEAVEVCRRAVELAPNLAATNSSLGFVLLEQGATQEALHWLRRAIELDPADSVTHSSMLFCLAHSNDIDRRTLLDEHRRFGKRYDLSPRTRPAIHANTRETGRKLQIGFVSGDLFNHAVASYAVPVIEHLAADPGVALHFYHNYTSEDQVSDRLKACAAGWRNICGASDRAFIDMVKRDRIDILIDLSGHTGRNRLVALAQRPAPVQASWIGYPATTGLAAIDYYLADRFLAPPGLLDDQFTEKIVRLPAIAPFMPPPHCPPVNLLPATHNGFTTYGSFNRLNKLNRDVIAVWARILHADPTARMALGAIGNDGDERTLTEWFAEAGIDAARLRFHRRSNTPTYLQQHHGVDLCVDTFPYTGSTTTLNALWMGVPTVTLPGTTMAGRGSACWLHHVGLDEYIARDVDDFVAKALALGHDVDTLRALRTGLRERCLMSAAFQPQTIADGLSSALRTMWARWCADEPAIAFDTPLPDALQSDAPPPDALLPAAPRIAVSV